MSDLEVGDTVMVSGEKSDGTITATSIREGALDGPMRDGIGGGRPGAGQGADSSSDGRRRAVAAEASGSQEGVGGRCTGCSSS